MVQIEVGPNDEMGAANLNAGPLVKDQAWECLFVLGAARIMGSVQAAINLGVIR